MIGRLSGTLARKAAEAVILDVHGVGYEVTCPLSVLERLPVEGEPCALIIHTHVREDQIALYGFFEEAERALWRRLISVSGVGPKIAIACLGGMDLRALKAAIIDGDVKQLSSVPGVGKRTAERMILELGEALKGEAAAPEASLALHAHLYDLESALKNLGFKAQGVDKLVQELREVAAEMSFEALLKEALRRLRG
ncbi:Holliday junction branch migration protein RuvA [Myxococcota bacterium]|nr:Holliday junction branch migration protein RuvA [Myxococcota bacterium]MBU1432754.1 Holliday junction branch migration protein RuvA [Myxococcota bacterium]MBU1898372.1 Holliday junction branch migration protein RuvA [Myxococcota bacterium]